MSVKYGDLDMQAGYTRRHESESVGSLVAQPVSFPDVIEMKLFPLRSADCSRVGTSA